MKTEKEVKEMLKKLDKQGKDYAAAGQLSLAKATSNQVAMLEWVLGILNRADYEEF